MKLSDFDYDLPPELIAQMPREKRDQSDLLIASNLNRLEKVKFYQLLNYLQKGDLLVFNNSKVIKSKLVLKNEHKKIEVNLAEKIDDCRWKAFARPAKKLKEGDEFIFNAHNKTIHKVIVAKKLWMGEIELEFALNKISVFEFLNLFGETPLPLYIKRLPSERDKQRYQTVYSEKLGSAAAPTAGLHFTKELLEAIKAKGVETAFITLHVGAGTFLPVKTENIDEHKMHSEHCEILPESAHAINKAKTENRRIIAVGTTSLRTLEARVTNNIIKPGYFTTDIFIKPGFEFQVADHLLTNFHLPKSTLLMLTCAFGGYEQIMQIYAYAVEQKMRFFSYGDAMLIERKL